MLQYTATYTDLYQLTMAQVYFKKGHHKHKAVFDYFFRKLPYNSGYAVFAGLEDLLGTLEKLRFTPKDLKYLKAQGLDHQFIDYLGNFEFNGNIYSPQEGDVVFPTRPVLQVEANMVEAQVIETLLLNLLNFQTLIATKASRMRQVAGKRKLIDFGLRRAHSTGGYHASRAAVIGGFDATSNVVAAKDFGLAASGTMAHSFIQSYDDELTAFRHFAEERAGDCVLLVDTYNTLKSGVPNAIKTAKEMEKRGHRLNGIRLDSGDLAYLSKKSRKMLDEAELGYVKIAASNQLDEYVIKSLIEQNAPIDVFGVGTSLVTGQPDAALDGVYKLAWANGKPRIKLSENIGKITLPFKKQVYRMIDNGGLFAGADAVVVDGETSVETMYHPFDPLKSTSTEQYKAEPLLRQVMKNGKRITGKMPAAEISTYREQRLEKLTGEYKRFDNPHVYKVGISGKLKTQRDKLIDEHKKRS